MANRVKVPIPGSAGKFRFVDLDATAGAELGVNLTYQGRVLAPDEILNSAVQQGDTIFQSSFGGGSGGPGGDTTTDVVIEGRNLYFTKERAQDAIGEALDGTGDVPLTYDDAGNKISAALSATGVTAGAYGDATHVATFTVDAKGRLTLAGQVAITAGGDVATDPIWDAKGDLVGGTGANAAARLPVGANLAWLTPDSTATTGLRWSAHGRLDDAALTADRTFAVPDYAGTVAVLDSNSAIHADVFSRHGVIGATPTSGATWAGMEAGVGIGSLISYDGSTKNYVQFWTDNGVTFPRQIAALGTVAVSLSSSQNNYSPTGLDTANRLEITASSDLSLTGLDATKLSSGAILSIRNVGTANTVTLRHQSASSSASNRFLLPGGADIALSPGAAFLALYDFTATRVVAFAQGESGAGGSALQYREDILASPGLGTAYFTTDKTIYCYDVQFRGATRYTVWPDETTLDSSTQVTLNAGTLGTEDYLFRYWTADAGAVGATTLNVTALVPVTWSPTDKNGGITLSNSNRDAAGSSFVSVRSSSGKASGKVYLELEKLSSGSNTIVCGAADSSASLTTYPGADSHGWGFQIDYPSGPYAYHAGAIGVVSSLSGQYCSASGDRAMLALDLDNGRGWIGIKGTWDGNPSAGTGATFTFTPGTQLFVMTGLSASPGLRIHSGQDAFSYTVPTGFDSGFYV